MSIVRKIRRSLKRGGLRETVALCFKNVIPLRSKDNQPTQFDLQYGVATEGRVELGDLDIHSDSDLFGVGYSPTPPKVFRKIMSLLPDPRKYSFVDLGSGKGRVVLMAALEPFKSVTGVEFSHELCGMAEANLAKFRPNVKAGEVSIVCADASRFQFPAGPLIVYCYFAFSQEVLKPVLAVLSRRTDETIFVYYNAHYPELFTGFELYRQDSGIDIWRRAVSQVAR